MQKILIVDDKKNICKTLSTILKKEGYIVESSNNVWDALQKTRSFDPQLIISDIRMPDMDGIDFFKSLKAEKINIPLIFITAYGSIPLAVETVKDGAVDFLTKPLDYKELKAKIKKYIGKDIKHKKNSNQYKFKKMIGSSQKMKELLQLITRVASVDSTVLILGESGVGKELVARAVHYLSPRAENEFVAVNCASLNREIFESELFGHKKGSFTGAVSDKAGKFEQADGGTILLDEISEIDLHSQAKLLRVLQEKTIERVGENRQRPIDVKIAAASNRNLKKMVEEGKFRKDLYYRLNVMEIYVPPLREHKEDIRELVDYFNAEISRESAQSEKVISEEVYKILYEYDWPGNIRELKNIMERMVLLVSDDLIKALHLPEYLRGNIKSEHSEIDERKKIVKALKKTFGNKSKAAERLNLSRKTIYNKIDKYNIKREEYKN